MACDEFNPCTDCGCEETPTTPPIYVIPCNEPVEACEEIATANCITYQAGSIIEGTINYNDSLNLVIEKLVELIQLNPQPADSVEMIVDVLDSTSAVFNWSASDLPGAIYNLDISTDEVLWTSVYEGDLLTYTATGLTAATVYYYRITVQVFGYSDGTPTTGTFTTNA